MDPISLGFGAISLGSSLFGLFGKSRGSINPGTASQFNWLEAKNSQLEEQRMHLDATRRRRDIMRQAQVATALSENTAANSGAINSSGIEGARAGISGQAGVNTLGVTQNEEIATQMFGIKRMQGLLNYQMKGQQSQGTDFASGIGNILGNNADELSRLLRFGGTKFGLF